MFFFHQSGIALKRGVLGRKNITAMSTVKPISENLHRTFFFIYPPLKNKNFSKIIEIKKLSYRLFILGLSQRNNVPLAVFHLHVLCNLYNNCIVLHLFQNS